MTPTDRARLAGDLAAFALQTTEQAAALAAADDRAGLFWLCMTAPIAQRANIERHQPMSGYTGTNIALRPWQVAPSKDSVVMSDRSPDLGLWSRTMPTTIDPAQPLPPIDLDGVETP